MLQEELGISDDEFDDIQSLFQVHYMLHKINHFMGMFVSTDPSVEFSTFFYGFPKWTISNTNIMFLWNLEMSWILKLSVQDNP